jgi:hypothetical protein
MGAADFGHYTSYIRSEGKWFDYNDLLVQEVEEKELLKTSYGEGSRSAYILFYTRRDVDENLPGPQIPAQLAEKYEKESQLNDEYRLFCSHSYFELMKKCARSQNLDFVAIAIYYYFDTFPFTTHVKRAVEIAPPICEHLIKSEDLRQKLLQIILHGPFSCSLIYCPEVGVRHGACQMISTIEAQQIPNNVLDRIFHEIGAIVPYYRVFDQMFELLASILARSEPARQYAVSRAWPTMLSHMIRVGFKEFILTKEVEEATLQVVTFGKHSGAGGNNAGKDATGESLENGGF